MPDWLMQLLVAGGGLGLIGTALGSWVKAWREDRKLAADRKHAADAAREARIEKLEAKVESLLMDALAARDETIKQLQGQNETSKQMVDVIGANTQALKEAAKQLAATTKDPP